MHTYTVHIIPANPASTDRGSIYTVEAINKYHACKQARRQCVQLDYDYDRHDGRLIVTAQREG